MYKYYKNIGKKGDNRGDVLKIIMQNIWKFFTEMCHNDVNSIPASYDTPIDYDIDYYRILDQHTTLNLVDPLLQGNQLFGQYFSLEDEASPDYQNIAFSFDWMEYPVIMYVPKKFSSYIATEYDISTEPYKEVYDDPAYIFFTFNPAIFSTDVREYHDSYTEHKVFSKLIPNDSGAPIIDKHYAGLTYNDCVTDVYPIWVINPFYNINNFVDDSTNNSVPIDLGMFLSLEEHTFILGFVHHNEVDHVQYSFISSMPDTKTVPGCDIKADFLVRSDILAYKRNHDSDTFIFSHSTVADDPYNRRRSSPNVNIMAVNATADSNITDDLLFPQNYIYNFHTYKNVAMFDNQERMCWVNKWLPPTDDNYFKAGKNGNYVNTATGKVPELNVYISIGNFPRHTFGEAVFPDPKTFDSLNGDYTYHTPMFPSMLRNTLNSHVVLFPAVVCLEREPINKPSDLSSVFCKLPFFAATDIMYDQDRDIHELNVAGYTYLCFESSEYNDNVQVCLLVGKKLDPAI